MTNIIDKAIKNYAALPPAEQIKIKAAWGSIGAFFAYLAFIGVTERWQKALGIFLAVALFCTVAVIATWFGMVLGKVIGQKAGMTVSVILIFAFIGFVLYLIGSNWG